MSILRLSEPLNCQLSQAKMGSAGIFWFISHQSINLKLTWIDMPAGKEVFHATVAVANLVTYEIKPGKFPR